MRRGCEKRPHQLVRTAVLRQIPHLYRPILIAADQLALVGVDDNLVDWCLVVVVPLDMARPGVPDLERVVFGRGHEPFGLAVEG